LTGMDGPPRFVVTQHSDGKVGLAHARLTAFV
jgi:hypothetical protein